jgi:hypothetical protein
MQKYFYFWIFFIMVSAIYHGYKNYKENKDAGYNKVHFEKTGKRVEFHGGLKETISCTIAASLGLIFSPVFLAIETVKFVPAAIVLYFIS